MTRLTEILKQYPPITLEEMSAVRLMHRTDTKFVTDTEHMMQLLELAKNDYFVQVIDGEPIAKYDTTYFDTYDYNMFYVHQTGHVNRQKIRFRTYVASALQFMEVKTKNNHGRTKKKRIPVEDMDLTDQTKIDFLKQHLHYNLDDLRPAIRNEFQRITLVNKGLTERLTIDMNIKFYNLVSGLQRDTSGIVVIELKRDGLCFSPILDMLRQLRIQPHGFSKYCMGSAMTNPELRVNRFKQKMIEVRKLTGFPMLPR